MNIFVTGVAGFLGSHLRDALTGLGHNVHGCDIAEPDGIDFDYIPGDCRNLDRMNKWLRNFNTEVVIHCAALPHEGLSVFSPLTIGDSIYRGSVATFSAAISSGVRRIVACSSMSRYGAGTPPFSEDDRPAPVDPYGVAKVAAEETLRCLALAHGVEYVIAVPHSIIGERQAIDPFRNVATIFANRMLRGLPPLVYGDGEQARSFSYVGDVISSLVKMATSDDPRVLGQTINVGPDELDTIITINDLVEMMKPMCGFNGQAIHFPDRPLEVKRAFCASGKARKILGYKTKTSLDEGLRRLVQSVRERGPRPFVYHLPIEIDAPSLPETWKRKLL